MTPENLPASVLEQCQADGVTVALVDGKLVITGQQAALDEWRPLLRDLKPELLELMKRAAAPSDRYTAALMHRGIKPGPAHALALRLVTRDAQHDERRLCLECSHLFDTTRAARCAQWRQAGWGGPQLPRELPTILQRCKAFHLVGLESDSTPAHYTPRARATEPARPPTHLEEATP